MKEVVEKAKEDGYVETLFHRRRYLPELTASNFNLRAFEMCIRDKSVAEGWKVL